MPEITDESQAQQVCYGPCPAGWYVSHIVPWSLCPDGHQMRIEKLGASRIHCSSTHPVPDGYAIVQVVPNWFTYNGIRFDKFICDKLGAQQMTICACAGIPPGYALIQEMQWSPCTGATYCTDGSAYVIRKIE